MVFSGLFIYGASKISVPSLRVILIKCSVFISFFVPMPDIPPTTAPTTPNINPPARARAITDFSFSVMVFSDSGFIDLISLSSIVFSIVVLSFL